MLQFKFNVYIIFFSLIITIYQEDLTRYLEIRKNPAMILTNFQKLRTWTQHLEAFHILAQFPLTRRQTELANYHHNVNVQATKRRKTQELRKLGKWKKISRKGPQQDSGSEGGGEGARQKFLGYSQAMLKELVKRNTLHLCKRYYIAFNSHQKPV